MSLKGRRILSALLVCITLIAATLVWNAAYGAEQHPIIDKIINNQNTIEMGAGWYRVVIKENLSETEFDWRFDVRVIETNGRDLVIVHREEQNSGQHPDSNWVIEHIYVDGFGDNVLDQYSKDRFISIKAGGGWYRVSVTWPDNFRYPDLLAEEEGAELYKKELEWWDNKL